MRLLLKLLIPLTVVVWLPPLGAEPTELVVRVISRDAKFVGTSVGGARIVVQDELSGAVLAQGLTEGGTGSTDRIMRESWQRDRPLATDGAASFRTTLELDEPTRVRVTAWGPTRYPGSANSVSATRWILPGRSIAAGDGWLLELPGLVVEIHDTAELLRLDGGSRELPVRARVSMMCGCPLTPGGLWNSEEFEISARLSRDGELIASAPLGYAGQASEFEGRLPVAEPGRYELSIWAHQPATGNSGVDRLTLIAD